ncbi:MAG TPA: OmpA family protein, partial [Leptospiraceae bacterium]|nr:OmpA family protein [Leptospiraceae bacterium]
NSEQRTANSEQRTANSEQVQFRFKPPIFGDLHKFKNSKLLSVIFAKAKSIFSLIFILLILSQCDGILPDSSFYSTMVRGRSKIVELDNSRRYVYHRKDEKDKITYCLENVGPSTKDEFYKLMLTQPNGQKANVDWGTNASNIYNVSDIMQFGSTMLFRLCENYINGFYDDYGKDKSRYYREDFKDVLRRVTLLLAIQSSKDTGKEAIVTIINLIDQKYDLEKEKNILEKELSSLKEKLNELIKSNKSEEKTATEKEIVSRSTEIQQLTVKIAKMDELTKTIETTAGCKENNPCGDRKDPKKPDETSSDKPESKNQTYQIESVFFMKGKSDILAFSQTSIENILPVFNSNSYKLAILSYADRDGELRDNRDLSCKRSESVLNKLKSITNGTSKDSFEKRVTAYGCGESHHVKIYNETALTGAERQKLEKSLSRRTDFLFYDKDIPERLKGCECRK